MSAAEPYHLNREAAIPAELFFKCANYTALCLLYLCKNSHLTKPLAFEHLKPRALGHWGCVPGINFVWSCLLPAISATKADVRLFVGTGHAGASWLACSYLDGSLALAYPEFTASEGGLDRLCALFGRTGGLPTELSAAYPGVLWPSGELGTNLAVAHGHALAHSSAKSIALLGDGELETGPTSAALHALRTVPTANLSIIVNLNGLRMGGPSAIACWPSSSLLRLLDALGMETETVLGFDAARVVSWCVGSLSSKSNKTRVLLLITPKGATAPVTPGGDHIAGTIRSHKAPIKAIEDPHSLGWLEAWLRSYSPRDIFTRNELNVARFRDILPPEDMLPAMVARRLRSSFIVDRRQAVSTSGDHNSAESLVLAFVNALSDSSDSQYPTLLTCPDELESNRLGDLHRVGVEIREYLSEHLCLAWSIGAAIGNRRTWFASYDAFATIVTSIVSQYLKFLDTKLEYFGGIIPGSVNILLTSLGWRNVYSHQDPGFATSLLEKRFASFRCYLPTTAESMVSIVEKCHLSRGLVNCVIADKYSCAKPPVTRLKWSPIWCAYPIAESDDLAPTIMIVVVGDYILGEAIKAATALDLTCGKSLCQVTVIEEITCLYRAGAEAKELVERLSQQLRHVVATFVIASLYEPVLRSLVADLIGTTAIPIVSRGFRSRPKTTTSVGSLLDARCTWMQIATDVLALLPRDEMRQETYIKVEASLIEYEKCVEAAAAEAYDDPPWYWTTGAETVLRAATN